MVQYAGRVATGQPIVQYAGRVVHLWNSMFEERPAYDTVCRRVNCLWYSMPEERPAYGTVCRKSKLPMVQYMPEERPAYVAVCRKRGLPMVQHAGREACLWYSMPACMLFSRV